MLGISALGSSIYWERFGVQGLYLWCMSVCVRVSVCVNVCVCVNGRGGRGEGRIGNGLGAFGRVWGFVGTFRIVWECLGSLWNVLNRFGSV